MSVHNKNITQHLVKVSHTTFKACYFKQSTFKWI